MQRTEFEDNSEVVFEFLLNGVSWHEGLTLKTPTMEVVSHGQIPVGCYFPLEIGLHNISHQSVEDLKYRIGLIVPDILKVSGKKDNESIDIIHLKENVQLVKLKGFGTLFPDEWDGISIGFDFDDRIEKLVFSSPLEFILRLFLSSGPKDFKFNAICQQP